MAGPRLGPANLGVVVNLADPDSVWLGEYYRAQRHIPADNLLTVRFEPGQPVMARAQFERLYADLGGRIPAGVEALALTWAAPYRVDCMSITTAFAIGFDAQFCATGCQPTRRSPYFDSDTRRPYTTHGWRPTMIIAAGDLDGALALVERGIAADGTFPRGTGYLLRTGDRARSARARAFPAIVELLGRRVRLRYLERDYIEDRHDVLFYFTGLKQVPALDTLTFRPGAIADHLTSAGGKLTGSRQMSALAWIDAGATGSYGTVVEPCNLLEKFPAPGVVIARYLAGETLMEAYWKSVAMPGQGVFVGEPLAAPFAPPAD
ncbi:MAG: TIGR03790 family protein [Gammaproteobacteria bacterium]|nr:TIGR03790 family protein [Gammaproteobacteria bacterium]